MKQSGKIKALLSILVLCVIAVTGCKSDKSGDSEKLSIITTLFPQYDFARQIVGDKADVTLLLSPGVEAHSYDPTPADIVKINKADIFIYTGDNMESWAADILSGIDNENLDVLDVSKGIKLVKTEEEHSDEEDEDEDAHEHEYDPHIWTSPVNAITMVENILNELVKTDPDNKEYYKENAAKLTKDLNELDSEFKEVVKNADIKTIYFGGRFAMYYFAKEYGLQYEAAFDSCSSETEPSAKRVARIINDMKADNAAVIYYEELVDPKSAKSIAEATGAETLLLHSCHNVSKEEMDAGVTYVSLMKQNVKNLKEGLIANASNNAS